MCICWTGISMAIALISNGIYEYRLLDAKACLEPDFKLGYRAIPLQTSYMGNGWFGSELAR